MSDTVTEILQGAYDALAAREQRLQPFVDELALVRKHRRELGKQLGIRATDTPQGKAPASPKGDGRGRGGIDPDKGIARQYMDAIRSSLDPLTGQEIAEKAGLEWGPPGARILGKLAASGQLIRIEQDGPNKYGLPQALDTVDPADNGVA